MHQLSVSTIISILCSITCMAQWAELPPMNQERASAMSVWLDGKLYVFGGRGMTSADAYMRSAQALDVVSGEWSPIADLPHPGYGGYATAIDGTIYIVDGFSGSGRFSTLWAYDPISDRYVAKAALPEGIEYGAGATIGSRIYLIAGVLDDSNRIRQAVYRYDPTTDSWSEFGSAPLDARQPTAATIDGAIYIVGSYFGPGETKMAFSGTIGDSSIVWSRIADYPSGIGGAVSGSLGGKLYVAEGYPGTAPTPTSALFRYDPDASVWSRSYLLPVPSAQGTISMPGDGSSLYYVGGYGSRQLLRLQEGAPSPVAVLEAERLNFSIGRAGSAQMSRILRVWNNGVLPLTISPEIASDARTWLNATTSPVAIEPGDTASIEVAADASGMAVGDYRTVLILHTNDPSGGTIPVEVRLFVRESLPRQRTNVVIEAAAASWCWWCSYADDSLALVKREYPSNAIVVQYHGPDSRDSLTITAGEQLATLLGHDNTWPYASIQRRIFPGLSVPMLPMISGMASWNQHVRDLLQGEPSAPVAIEIGDYQYDGKTKRLRVRLRATTAEALRFDSLHRYRVTVVVVEDSINYRQIKYDRDLGRNIVLYPYVHNDVARAIWPDPYGSELAVADSLVKDGLLLPGSVLEQEISFVVRNVGDTARSHVVFIVHESVNGRPGEIMQGYRRPLPAVEPLTLLMSTEYSERTIGLHDTARFRSIVTNSDDSPHVISLTRVANVLPDPEWSVWYCIDGSCLQQDADTTFLLAAGSSATVDAHVYGGSAGTGSATFRVTSDRGESREQTFIVTTLGTSRVDEREERIGVLSLSQNVPGPARGTTRLPNRIPGERK
jgi:N-acetylneuraminic acid mutarotase